MSAGLVLLPQTSLLLKHAFWLSAAARWVLAGQLPLSQHAVQAFEIQSCISAGIVLLFLSYLLVWCLTISRACWCGVSLLALLVCVVSYYQQCLLVWGLTIDHACLCGVSIKAMHSSVVLHYQPCLLVWCFVIRHAFWCCTSLSAMPMCVVAHYRTCLLVWCLTVGYAFWCVG